MKQETRGKIGPSVVRQPPIASTPRHNMSGGLNGERVGNVDRDKRGFSYFELPLPSVRVHSEELLNRPFCFISR